MVTRLVQRTYQVVAFDLDIDALGRAESNGAEGAASITDLAARLGAPRVVWTVVPHGEAVHKMVTELMKHLTAGDAIVDGGNSHDTDSLEHAQRCEQRDLLFLDVGMSGGVWGLEIGCCLGNRATAGWTEYAAGRRRNRTWRRLGRPGRRAPGHLRTPNRRRP